MNVEAGFGRDQHRLRSIYADHVLDLLTNALRLGGGQVDLVQDRNNVEPRIDRLIHISQRLRLNALTSINNKQRPLASRQTARNLIAEVHMSRRVHEIQNVSLAVFGRIGEAHGLRLDCDAALALDVHRVEHLGFHVARVERAAKLDQAVGKRGLAVVNMGNDREVANVAEVGHGGRGDSRSHPPCRAAKCLGFESLARLVIAPPVTPDHTPAPDFANAPAFARAAQTLGNRN